MITQTMRYGIGIFNKAHAFQQGEKASGPHCINMDLQQPMFFLFFFPFNRNETSNFIKKQANLLDKQQRCMMKHLPFTLNNQ